MAYSKQIRNYPLTVPWLNAQHKIHAAVLIGNRQTNKFSRLYWQQLLATELSLCNFNSVIRQINPNNKEEQNIVSFPSWRDIWPLITYYFYYHFLYKLFISYISNSGHGATRLRRTFWLSCFLSAQHTQPLRPLFSAVEIGICVHVLFYVKPYFFLNIHSFLLLHE